MALSTRTAGQNPIDSSAINQFVQALTGVMKDQPFTLANSLSVTNTLTASSNMTVGGTLTFNGTLTASSNLSVTNTLTASSTVTLSGLSSGGLVSTGIGGTLQTVVPSSAVTTFASSDTTGMTTGTFFTCVTHSQTLSASTVYVLSANANVSGTNGDYFLGELFDVTSSAVIAVGVTTGTAHRMNIAVPPTAYSPPAGPATITLRVQDSNSSTGTVSRDDGVTGLNKATWITSAKTST